MKKLSLLLFSLFTLTTFSACETDGDLYTPDAIVTVRTSTAASMYFVDDNNKKIYPGDTSRIPAYVPKDGQRAIIRYSFLEEKIEGFDYNITVYDILNIYTGKALSMTTQEFASMPQDGINIALNYMGKPNVILTKDYLTLNVVYKSGENKKHSFNLVHLNNDSKAPEAPEYLDLTLQHDKKEDTGVYQKYDFISFSMSEIAELLNGKKGVNLHMKSMDGQERSIKIDIHAYNGK